MGLKQSVVPNEDLDLILSALHLISLFFFLLSNIASDLHFFIISRYCISHRIITDGYGAKNKKEILYNIARKTANQLWRKQVFSIKYILIICEY